jgi:hypothetical protein
MIHKRCNQNAGLDFNEDGKITKAEEAAGVHAKLEKRLTEEYAREFIATV